MFEQLVTTVLFFAFSFTSAVAQGCSPSAGMGIQQWYSICSPALEQAYAQGMGGTLSYDNFVRSMYQTYALPVVPRPMPSGSGMMCSVGQTQCFNGYWRQCQAMPTGGSWWVTGPQQCR